MGRQFTSSIPTQSHDTAVPECGVGQSLAPMPYRLTVACYDEAVYEIGHRRQRFKSAGAPQDALRDDTSLLGQEGAETLGLFPRHHLYRPFA